MSHFQANLDLLHKVSEPLAAKMEAFHATTGEPLSFAGFTLEPARNGALTIKYSDEERSFYLHSPYDPQREAEQFADSVLEQMPDASFTIFFGMGLGYGTLEAIRRLPSKHRVMIFEPHWELFYLAFCHCDLSVLLTRPLTTVSCEPSMQGAMMSYMNLFELAGFSGVRLVSNAVFERLPQAHCFNEFAQRVRYEMTMVSGNVQTLMVMGEMQQMNIIINFPHVLDNPPFKHLLGAFKDRPAVIVSAGPSLEKNMHLLHELDDRALIIAVDTSTKPLLAAGITPHVVVSGDPQEANYRHLKGVDLPQTYLITEPQSPVATLTTWTGPKFICSFHDNAMQWVDRVLGHRGRVLVWGSVAVMAYDVAVKIGANPIVFIGQDLSFPGGRTYTKGTFFETEEKKQLTVDELKREGTTLIDMVDIYGEPVKTNRQMYAYFNFLLNRFLDPEVDGRMIINATEGGILQSERVTVMPFADVIDKYMSAPHDIRGVLAQAHAQGNAINYTNLQLELDTLLAAFREAHSNCITALDAIKLTLGAIETDDDSVLAKQEVLEHYNRVVKLRNTLVRNIEASRMVEMSNHSGIYSFAQGVKRVEPGEDGYSNEFIKRACYHYHTLYITTRDGTARLIPLFEAAREAARQRMDLERVAVGA
jgi:hypothetical protein